MRFWGFLVLKLVCWAGLMYGLWVGLEALLPPALPFMHVVPKSRFGHDLVYTLVLLGYNLVCQGLLYLIAWDQRYRCRTCLRRLRMPVESGSWSYPLTFGPPHTEYICRYGHGTLDVPEVTGLGKAHWTPHADLWKELCEIEDGTK